MHSSGSGRRRPGQCGSYGNNVTKPRRPQGSRQLNGTLDEVMLWARALSETEIARFYRTRR